MSNILTSKFARILQRFSETEIKSFEMWLRSPWCNTNKNVGRLVERMKRFHPHFAEEHLTKEWLFRQVLPDGKFSERRMNNLLSEAAQAAETFLSAQHMQQHPHMQQEILMEEWRARGFDEWFFKESTAAVATLRQKNVREWEDQSYLFRLYQQQYYRPARERYLPTTSQLLVHMDAQLDILYLLEKASLLNEKMFRSRVFREECTDVEEALERWLAASVGIDHPALGLYRMRFAYSKRPLRAQYEAVWEAFEANFAALNAREQEIHLLSLLNDAKWLIKAGQMDIGEILPLYRFGLASGTLLQRGKLTYSTFTTILSVSNTQGDVAFTTYIIDTHAKSLDASGRKDGMVWARAHTAYWQQDLEKTRKLLQNYEFKTSHFQIIGRVLQVQTYFDLSLEDRSYQLYLLSFLDTYERWLQRHETLSKEMKIGFLRFVQACRTMLKYYTGVDAKMAHLDKLLNGTTHIQALPWLLQRKEMVLRLHAKGNATKKAQLISTSSVTGPS